MWASLRRPGLYRVRCRHERAVLGEHLGFSRVGCLGADRRRVFIVGLILLVLLLVLLFGGLGFAVHLLWIVAAIALVAWIFGFAFRSGESARWYRW